MDDKHRIWDSFWQDRRVLCPGPDADPVIASSFRAYWAEAAGALPDGARILDLACGNGFVALTAAEAAEAAGKTLRIDAIDAAEIDPRRYVPEWAKRPAGPAFHPRALMESLPFEAGCFDAVYSQYGIEFGNITKAAAEVGRVLKPGGSVRILALPKGAPFTESLPRKTKQARYLVEKTKLFDVAMAVAQAIHAKETKGEGREAIQYLQRFSAEVQSVMQAVDDKDSALAGVAASVLQETLTKRNEVPIETQIATMQSVKTRLAELAARNETYDRAALGDASLTALLRDLKKTGRGDFRSQARAAGEAGTVAWAVNN